jgi:hypothetical protein
MLREARLQDRHDLGRVVDGERRLRDEGEAIGVPGLDRARILGRLDEAHGPFGQLAHGADHLGVTGMADQENFIAAAWWRSASTMDLRDQRTGRIKVKEVAETGGSGNGLRHAVRRKYHGGIRFRDFVQLLHKYGAFPPEVLDHELVVNDLVPHIDRGAESSER